MMLCDDHRVDRTTNPIGERDPLAEPPRAILHLAAGSVMSMLTDPAPGDAWRDLAEPSLGSDPAAGRRCHDTAID